MKINKIIANPCIIIPEAATPREKFAAEELAKYIFKITGTKLTILSDEESVSGAKIIIGNPNRNLLAKKVMSMDEFNSEVRGGEGFLIKSIDDNTLLIAGGNGDFERGTVYAVYELLERFCGCSLAAFTNPCIAGGEFVPKCDELLLDNINYCKPCADTVYRTAIVQYGDAGGKVSHKLNIPFLEWLCKNRYNRILTWMEVYEELKKSGLLDEAVRRGINFTVGHHGSARHFMPPYGNSYFNERYYETHPEYYKLLEDGTRFCITDHMGQCVFCSRNDDVYDVLSANIVKWINDNPLVDTIAFWPQDGTAPDCQCEKCRQYSKVENYTYFMNELAVRIGKICPHVKIDMLLYTDLWECPDNVELSTNLMVDEATWHDSGLRTVGKPDGSCIAGTFFEDNLLKWHEKGAKAVYYDYFMGVYPARNRLIPMADEVQAMAKRFDEKGVYGSGTQIECFNMWNHIFNFYTFARTLYNHDLSMENNMDIFCRIFGGGAEEIKKIIRMCEACMDGQAPVDQAGWHLMNTIDKEQIYSLYDTAFEKAETPLFRNNIRMHRMVFRYTDLETQQIGAEEQYPYEAVKNYPDINAELLHMTRFDSFYYDNTGYGIMIPVQGESTEEYVPDKWYQMEEKMKEFKKDKLSVKIASTRKEMGDIAAVDIADTIIELQKEKDELNMIFAAAPSQNEVLESLISNKDIDWTKINAFHMDEYIGLSADAPQRFGNFLKNAIFGKVPFKSVNYINGGAEDIEAECKRYTELLKKFPTDIVCMGVGENGHIAFNDPPVADFNDDKVIKKVELDDVCRNQQVNDGCFAKFDDVPTHALTLTVPTLMSGKHLFCVVPAPTKADAIERMINGDITTECPASILRNHESAILYCDSDSASKLD